MSGEKIKCPICGSTQITAGNKGFGLGKSAAGLVLLGPVGLLGGLVGSKKIKITCLKCGHSWLPVKEANIRNEEIIKTIKPYAGEHKECPNCGADNRVTRKDCWSCGHEF